MITEIKEEEGRDGALRETFKKTELQPVVNAALLFVHSAVLRLGRCQNRPVAATCRDLGTADTVGEKIDP